MKWLESQTLSQSSRLRLWAQALGLSLILSIGNPPLGEAAPLQSGVLQAHAGQDAPGPLFRQPILSAIRSLAGSQPPEGEGEAAILNAVAGYYDRYGAVPAWWTDEAGAGQVQAAAAALARAVQANGLETGDYPLDAIQRLSRLPAPDKTDRAQADVLLTLSVARFAQQVRHGRLDPRAVNEILDYPVRTGDLPRSVAFIAAVSSPELLLARLNALAPSHDGYQRLRELLAQTRQSEIWQGIGEGPLLQPGESDSRVPALRRRLAAAGGYGFRPHGDIQSTRYDLRLAAAVERFQTRHGLDVDGLIGGMTQRAMNASRADRITQIAMNMERWRWLPDHLGRDHVMVNIPDYHLEIIEAGHVARRMPVIVGKPDRKTPAFSSRLTWLEINPTWTLTERIAQKDLLPKLVENPAYLAERNITMFASWNNDAPEVDARFLDWSVLGEGIRYFRLRQDPGPENPLGRVKFMMENSFSVYLHDTNEPGLFGHTARPFSSGCIRVADPRWLTGYLVNRPELWTEEAQEEPFQDWETKRLVLKRPLAIHLAYFTSWTDVAGAVQVRDDIYGFDAQMAEAWSQLRESAVSLASLN